MKSLVEIFAEIGHFGNDIGANDKNSTHSYLPVYDELFKPFRIGCNFLEIGLATGDSLRLWCKYFYESNIVGADISVVFNKADIDPVTNALTVIEADATKEDFLGYFRYQTFDIIVEDASHLEEDQAKTFNLMKTKMKTGGIYIVEDILAIDYSRNRFESLHPSCEIYDMRHINGRFDNVLAVYKF